MIGDSPPGNSAFGVNSCTTEFVSDRTRGIVSRTARKSAQTRSAVISIGGINSFFRGHSHSLGCEGPSQKICAIGQLRRPSKTCNLQNPHPGLSVSRSSPLVSRHHYSCKRRSHYKSLILLTHLR